ncbi:MAG: thioredoxin domain-containing protein [Anaerolineales bacterium]|nr:thioredoxin domain-containing protein [Anaerolineales bacterium]
MSQTSNASKRQTRREQLRRRETRGRNIGMILIVLGALFIAFLVIWPNVRPITNVTKIEPNKREKADFNNQGDPNAPVHITEFADYQCPFCERFFTDTEGQLEEVYVNTGKVYFTYRSAGNWVSGNIGQGKTESEDAAKAAYCAADQEMFWEMHDMLYSNVIGEDAGSFTDRRLSVIAESTGLNVAQFDECYSSNKYQDQVDLDFKEAVQAGVQGTPTFILTYKDATGQEVTENIDGAQPFSVFQEKIEAALAITAGN